MSGGGPDADDGDPIAALLSDAADPAVDSYACLLLPPAPTEPSAVRRRFLALSLRVHPDKHVGDATRKADATAAFQKLSTAFEVLYDREGQAAHLEALRLRRRGEEAEGARRRRRAEADGGGKGKRRRGDEGWRARSKEKRRRKKAEAAAAERGFWSTARSWTAVVEEMRRRETLERDFVRARSDERMGRRVQGMVWRAMRICRTLDERAGCPPTFVNGLWAPLYEQEVLKEGGLPEGWEVRIEEPAEVDPGSDARPPRRIYRCASTGEERTDHPTPDVERLLKRAGAAELTNKYRFHTEPRMFLNEIVEYLREDYDYLDMHDDLAELEEEERARDDEDRDGGQRERQEYDF